uniref:hybrid sensor histidine kinase/response regulator n=1 Tax=Sphingomonas sp. TaxID=28214 RepID=UPI002DD6594A
GQIDSFRGEVRFNTADGGSRWMLVSARSIRDASGVLRGGTGTLTDISAAKAVEADLVAARAAAEVANQAKSEFLSAMSHELRTPLNAVIGLSESLLEAGAAVDATRTRRYLGIIHDSGKQLLAQINDILDLARIEAGRIQLNVTSFDLGLLAAAAVESVQRDARAKHLVTEVQRPPAPLIVSADERLLRQVVQNLVSNAVKFTPARGGVTVSVATNAAGTVVIAVRDTGIGIPPDKLDRLFKPFSQVDSSLARAFGGTGLGLVLVQRLVRLHGGTVTVASTPGAGSTFTIELPASIVVPPVTPPADLPPRARRVVLVDDDPRQHTLVGDYLRDHRIEVVHCDSGESALQAIAAAEPGLALVDINMPGMNGLDLIARLRQTPHGRNLPIVAVSALTEAEAVARCRAAGANAHLPKPVSLTALALNLRTFAGLAP